MAWNVAVPRLDPKKQAAAYGAGRSSGSELLPRVKHGERYAPKPAEPQPIKPVQITLPHCCWDGMIQ
jgi:hypothetical protein